MVIRPIAFLTLAIGSVLILLQVYRLTSHSFASAEVQSTETYLGECRRPSGRYEECARIRAAVSFRDKSRENPVQVKIDAGRATGHVVPGSFITVMYPSTTPEEAVVASLRKSWTAPLAVTALGIILFVFAKAARRPDSQPAKKDDKS